MQSNAVEAQSSPANLTNLTFDVDDEITACESGLHLVDDNPGDEIEIWGINYTFGGHSFSTFECSNSFYSI